MKIPLFIKIILLLVILFLIIYSIYIYNLSNNDFVDWLSTLISTLTSVLFALIIAMFLFYYQDNLIKKDTKNKYIMTIEKYLIEIWKASSNLKDPQITYFIDKEKLDIYLFNIHKIIFEQAICSNVFDVEETGFLLTMMTAIDYHNTVKEKYVNMSIRFDKNSKSDIESLRILHNNNKESITALKNTIESANKYFEFNELKKEIEEKVVAKLKNEHKS